MDRQLTFGKVQWNYHTQGTGPITLVCFPSLAGELQWLKKEMAVYGQLVAVIGIELPLVESIDTFLGGVNAILEAEGVQDVALMGGSYGGFLAQAFFFLNPDRVKQLILCDAVLPDPMIIAANRRAVALFKWIPTPIVRWMFRKKFSKLFNGFDKHQQRHRLTEIQNQFDRWISNDFSKELIIARLKLKMDIDKQVQSHPYEKTKVLITYSDNDPNADKSEKLAATFIGSQTHIFEGSGHFSRILHFEEFTDLICSFLQHPKK